MLIVNDSVVHAWVIRRLNKIILRDHKTTNSQPDKEVNFNDRASARFMQLLTQKRKREWYEPLLCDDDDKKERKGGPVDLWTSGPVDDDEHISQRSKIVENNWNAESHRFCIDCIDW